MRAESQFMEGKKHVVTLLRASFKSFQYVKHKSNLPSPISTRELWPLPPPSVIWQVYVPSLSSVK